VNTLGYIVEKWSLNIDARSPIEIPNTGRSDLARLFGELGFTIGVEIGVEQGLFAEELCQGNPNGLVYGVDAWQAYSDYRDHVSQAKLDGFFEDTLARLSSYNWRPIRGFSMDAVNNFRNGALDWVYIDANHELPFVLNDIIEWSKKIRRGGIIAGHDYRKSVRADTRNHVVYAVNCYTQSYRIKPWFLLGTKKMVPGEVRDTARSWFWVKV